MIGIIPVDILMTSGRLSEALPYLETAVKIDPAQTDLGLAPDESRTHISLGTALAVSGRLPEAAAEFESALRIDPNDAGARRNLGMALTGIPGRLPDALVHLEEADRLGPDPELEQAIERLRAELQGGGWP